MGDSMSGVILKGDTSGDVTLSVPAVAGSNTITVPASTGTMALTSQLPTVTRFKNRIINGDMRIDQRNAGASQTANNGVFPVDRFKLGMSQSSKGNAGQNLNSVTPPVGFVNYLGFASTSAYTCVSTDTFSIFHRLEGLNMTDLSWGTSNAKTVTLSFQVYSSLTGTFGGCIQNSAQARSYPYSYTISSANTWTQISITIPGDTTGTWLTTNSTGMIVQFALGYGSTYGSGTAGAWVSGDVESVTGAVSVVGTSGATFYITGVQVEVGSSATGFEYVDYGTQLSMCQRYFETSYPTGTAVGAANTAGIYTSSAIYGVATTSYILGHFSFKVMKRASPTMVSYDFAGTINTCTRDNVAVGSANGQTVAFQATGAAGTEIFSSGSYLATDINSNWTASAEL